MVFLKIYKKYEINEMEDIVGVLNLLLLYMICLLLWTQVVNKLPLLCNKLCGHICVRMKAISHTMRSEIWICCKMAIITWWQFYKRYHNHQSLRLAWKLLIQNFIQISQGSMSYQRQANRGENTAPGGGNNNVHKVKGYAIYHASKR